MGLWSEVRAAAGARAKRRRLLWRALAARHALDPRCNRTSAIGKTDILLFATIRDEAARLPAFLDHYRRLGVGHFLIVDNGSVDGSADLLSYEPDVSLWQTSAGYRAARFGMDWLGWLLLRYGHGHWCVTVDADELLLIPHHDSRTLQDLTGWLDTCGAQAMSAMMLDLYPRGGLSSEEVPLWFDAEGYDWEWLPRFRAISIRGGPRRRLFFPHNPQRAPHLHKVPLIRWNRRYVYVSSTHVALPRRLNAGFDARRGLPTGVLLHTKFDGGPARARQECARAQHFSDPAAYRGYYDAIAADPVLWTEQSQLLTGWQALEVLGLMSRGVWK